MIVLKRILALANKGRLTATIALIFIISNSFALLMEQHASADAYSWLTGSLSGEQPDSLTTNPDNYGAYGMCKTETIQFAGSNPSSDCVFHAKSFKYVITSGTLYVSMHGDEKMYPVTNVGFASYSYVIPSPETNDLVYGSIIVKDLPSKITFNSAYAGSYTPDNDFTTTISKDELNSDHTVGGRSVSRNGQWEVVNVENIGFVRIDRSDLSMMRFDSFQALNKYTAISNDGRFVTITSTNGSTPPTVYDLDGCGQDASQLQSSWYNSMMSAPCPSRNLSSALDNQFTSGWYKTVGKPEFNSDGWRITMLVDLNSSGTYRKGVVLNASGYDPSVVDPDHDGLNADMELAQGTSNTNADTDGDGLNDYVESIWYPSREAAFCNNLECTSHAYPDPTSKDLYVEIDWMKETGLLGRSFKPSTTQVGYITDAYAAQGINAHFDTGQYGGGNELPVYTQDLSFYITPTATDFYDYKYGDSAMPANFASDRYHVWHYLVSGYRYTQDTGSSGASYVGDDDSFVSTGLIQDSTSFPHVYDTDHAIAGTILHELGHSLCLSNQQEYANQSSECIYAGIHTLDNSTYDSYHSVMNYSYQMTDIVDLSSGLATPNDHNDWGAIQDGMKDFTSSDAEGIDPNSQSNRLMLPNSPTQIKNIPRITS